MIELTLNFLGQRTPFKFFPSFCIMSVSKQDALLTAMHNNIQQFVVELICYRLTK
jgi:hypothetical protein